MTKVKKEEKYPVAKRFDIADIQVSREAQAVKPEVVARLIKRAKRPVLVTGGYLLKEPELVEFAARMYEKGIPIVATGGSSKPLIEKGVNPLVVSYTLHHFTQYMQDEEWQGFDGNGKYDLVLYLGFIPYLLSRMLSSLKHFAKVTTVSLDQFYQPHAKFSFTNLTRNKEMHYRMLDELINML